MRKVSGFDAGLREALTVTVGIPGKKNLASAPKCPDS